MNIDNEPYPPFDSLWDELWKDVIEEKTFPTVRPHLAHYTSIEALESIVTSEELWFSSPLKMNDREELRFGIIQGERLFSEHGELKKACETLDRHETLLRYFNYYYDEFENKHAFDTYAFCFSEQERDESDGLLSMWRGYGGNGNGVAIVIDTSIFQIVEDKDSLLTLSNIHYAPSIDRLDWINRKLSDTAKLMTKQKIPDNKLYLVAYAFFERLKAFSIFTKHKGFEEEKEWRAVYFREEDRNDLLGPMLNYSVTSRGVEPKLKYKIGPINGIKGTENLSLERIISKIILGPSVSSPFALKTVERMLEKIGKHELSKKVVASSIPFRSD